jgi:iron-sulfur cluster assembly protein
MKPLITISPDAAAFLKPKLEGSAGLLVRVNKKGCAGGEYEFKILKSEEITAEFDSVTDNGIIVFFPKMLLMSIIGSELVLLKDQFNTRLDFKNPNEVSRCGCGESVQLPKT